MEGNAATLALSESKSMIDPGETSSSTTEDKEKKVVAEDSEALYRTVLGIHTKDEESSGGLCGTDPSEAFWEAQAFCLRSRGKTEIFLEEHFGKDAQRAARKAMKKKFKVAAEVFDGAFDAAMVKLGNVVHIGLNQCNDQLDVTLAYLCNDKISTEVVPNGPMNPSFTDLTDTDGTRTTFAGRRTAASLADTGTGTDTDTVQTPLRHLAKATSMTRSRSDNSYLVPLDKKKAKRKMFSNLMNAASATGEEGRKVASKENKQPPSKENRQPSEKSKKKASFVGVRGILANSRSKRQSMGASVDSDSFLDFKQSISKTLSAELGSHKTPSSPRHVSETGELELRQDSPQSKTSPLQIPTLQRTSSSPSVVDLTQDETVKATFDQYKQSYRKYGIRDQGGVTHIDLLEEHVDLVDNHIDLVDLVDKEVLPEDDGLIDLTNYGDRMSTW